MLERVGNCRIEAELAAGGMAVIYRAEQESLGRKVAIKALKTAVMEEAGFVERFEREARTLAQLQHENLVHVYDFYREHGALFIVMELVDGVNLYDLLDRARMLPPEVAAIIALQVARALDYLHFCGVLHRDLKPANILLTKSGVVKLGDFGIADDPRYGQDLTATGVGLGTPSYMSPEQILGERLDFRSDQFALGVVLYQMLSGRKPFIEDAGHSVMEKIRTLSPPALTVGEIGARIPPDLLAIVDRCLHKRRQDRFLAPQDLVLALERFLSQRVDVNYHARLVLFLRDQSWVSQSEAQAVLGPLASAPQRTGEAARQRAARGVTKRLALTLAGLSGALLLFLSGLHLLRVGEPLPGVVREGELAPAAGQLQIFAEPWAEVYLDDQLVETTPFARPLRVRPGRHFVELRNPHYQPYRQVVAIAPNQAHVLRVSLSELAQAAGAHQATAPAHADNPPAVTATLEPGR